MLRTPRRQELQRHLEEAGIQTLIHYPVPCHIQKVLGSHRIDPVSFYTTEYHAATFLSLPVDSFMSDQEVDRVITACNGFK